MAWIGVVISAFLTMAVYAYLVRNFNRAKPYSSELCELYLLRHMLPDGHPLSFMYKGLPRTRKTPRLLWPCVATFACAGITLTSTSLAIVFTVKGVLSSEGAEVTFLLLAIGSVVVALAVLMGVPTIQNYSCIKEMRRMGMAEIFQIRADIEKKRPGFYNT